MQSGAFLVITSTLRKTLHQDQLQAMLIKAGCRGRVYGTTPMLDYKDGVLYHGFTRGQEITAWLQTQPADVRYVVIDDDPDIAPHEAQTVRTQFDTGLTPELAHRALEILDGW
jgi:hypothetical protein